MAYEREAVSESPAIPNQTAVTREDRTIDPRAHATRLASVMSKMTTSSAQNVTSGSSPVVETTPPAETVTLSPHVAALARKEQKFRQDQQRLKAQQDALEAERAEIAELKAVKAKLAAKDYSALEGLVDYNEFSQYQINKLNGSDPSQEAIKALEARIDNLTRSQEESTSKLFEAAVSERRTAVNKLVETSPELAGIKKLKLQEHVVQHILDTWEHDNVELSVEEAAKDVQEELTARKKRLDDAFSPELPATQADPKKPLPALKAGLKTITNQVTTGDATAAPKKSMQHMSDAERWAEARRRAEAKLQNR